MKLTNRFAAWINLTRWNVVTVCFLLAQTRTRSSPPASALLLARELCCWLKLLRGPTVWGVSMHTRTISALAFAFFCSPIAVDICYAACSSLQAVAQQHANDMARRNSLDHAGFVRYRASAGAIAENVAMGCETEACARQMWMRSPAHRQNMMLGGCIAVASAKSSTGRRYWAMEIGGSNHVITDRSRVTLAARRATLRTNAHDGIVGREFSIDGINAP